MVAGIVSYFYLYIDDLIVKILEEIGSLKPSFLKKNTAANVNRNPYIILIITMNCVHIMKTLT
ncbi:MAG: hypothetical protein EA390_09245 [Balneolaceae bacterium]|nr:MAG: hypothetical protein EA390_09245 [Balneolaceae bacterium]